MLAPYPLIEPLPFHIGFADVAKLRHFKIDHHLVTALVERWRPETHTFHLSVGECTIILEDATLQLGIRVDGRPITGATYYDWEEMCEQYLGVVLPKGEVVVGSTIKLKWLQDNMPPLPLEPTQQQLEAHCRAYILWLIGGVLMLDKMGNQQELIGHHRIHWLRVLMVSISPFLDALESIAFIDSSIWIACTPLICFSIVEWHQADRVKLQFRLRQDIPNPPRNMDKLQKIEMRGRTDTNWAKKHAKWIRYWQQRQSMVLQGQPIIGHTKHSQEYMAWYQSNTIIFLNMQSPMNFETGQSSRATNIVQPECNPTYTPIPPMTDYIPPTYTPISPMTDYAFPSTSNMDYTSLIVQPDDFLSNVFGTDCGTLASAREYMHSL
ncbi:Serine/threonine-protein phosphatase 7 long form-like [Glycine soja]|uniref:Serine/threonine-protein phosphatase 7 long form-like n=1 Tax=Glycine soja TaxID=3848 RepID=A0A445H7G7_GLYSO|nr:Serine/threonine-protein phosphatase 7 long form-like [Glycine soja]